MNLADSRRGLPDLPFYRRFVGVGEATETDDLRTLRPVLIAGFVLADEVASTLPDGGTALISSASSRTALALAYALGGWPEIRVGGLTSAENRIFVARTGLLASVNTYSDVDAVVVDSEATAFVDFAGDGDLSRALHRSLASQLVVSMVIGGARATSVDSPTGLPGPVPILLSAPEADGRLRRERGSDQFEADNARFERSFLADAEDWLQVRVLDGREAAARELGALFTERPKPDQVTVIHV